MLVLLSTELPSPFCVTVVRQPVHPRQESRHEVRSDTVEGTPGLQFRARSEIVSYPAPSITDFSASVDEPATSELRNCHRSMMNRAGRHLTLRRLRSIIGTMSVPDYRPRPVTVTAPPLFGEVVERRLELQPLADVRVDRTPIAWPLVAAALLIPAVALAIAAGIPAL
jgi:hypothetical protein